MPDERFIRHESLCKSLYMVSTAHEHEWCEPRLHGFGLSREFHHTVGESACIASQIRHVDPFRPAIDGVVVHLAVTRQRKKRHGVNPAIRDADIARAHVNAVQRERFESRLDPHSSDLRREPLARLPVDLGSRAMVSLCVVSLDDGCYAPLNLGQRGRCLGGPNAARFRHASAVCPLTARKTLRSIALLQDPDAVQKLALRRSCACK
jgi:hypothetical protein